MKAYFGLDLGSKTIGIAHSASGLIAGALMTIRFQEHNYEEAFEKLKPLILEHQISTIVLGYPKHMNNDVGIRAQISETFKQRIETDVAVEVVLWDERMTTQSVFNVMKQGANKSQKKAKKDELAAVIILQNYLEYKEKRNA